MVRLNQWMNAITLSKKYQISPGGFDFTIVKPADKIAFGLFSLLFSNFATAI